MFGVNSEHLHYRPVSIPGNPTSHYVKQGLNYTLISDNKLVIPPGPLQLSSGGGIKQPTISGDEDHVTHKSTNGWCLLYM